MVEVEDAIGELSSLDTAQEFDISVVVGSREITGEAPVERSWAILGSELGYHSDGARRGTSFNS